jgi:arylamine N-acetyltransferase
MPFEQLRALVTMLIEPDLEPAQEQEQDDPTSEFESQLTTCLPRPPRTNTLDELIAALRAAPPPCHDTQRPRTRKRI